MKSIILALATCLCSVPAFADKIACSGASLALTTNSPEGGAHVIPEVLLILRGRVLIDESIYKDGVREAYYVFDDPETELKAPVREGDYVITYAEKNLKIFSNSDSTGQPLFSGPVVCRFDHYVGVPRPVVRP